jgi:hypothetical protein
MIRQRIHARIRNKSVNFIILGSDDSKKGFADMLAEA